MTRCKDDVFRKRFSGRLVEAMGKANATAYKMSKATGISKTMIYNMTGKKHTLPSMELLVLMCRYLNVSMDWLMGMTDETQLNKKYTDMLNTYKRFLLAVQRKEEKEKNHVGTMEPEEKAADEPVRAGATGNGTGHQRDGGQDS